MAVSDGVIDRVAALVPTPFYCYDADQVRQSLHSLKRHLPEGADIFYSLKANPNRAIVAILNREGAGAEVSSPAELKIAQAADVSRRRIICVGPAKSEGDLRACMAAGIKAIVAESLDELRMIAAIAAERGEVHPVAIRINPDFHSAKVRIAMTGRASQFGIDEAELPEVLAFFRGCRELVLVGLHVYLGSRILDAAAILENTRNILGMAARLRAMLGRQLAFVDIGGGFGVGYHEQERDLDAGMLGAGLGALIEAFRRDAPQTRVIIELGRFLVARAGTFVTRLRGVKASKGRHFAVCDGGSNVCAAASGFGAAMRRTFPIRGVGGGPAAREYTLTGPLCTPADVIGQAVPLPILQRGDLLRIDRTGAYGPSASPTQFLSFGHPAEVLIDGDAIVLVRRADPPEAIAALHIRETLGRLDPAPEIMAASPERELVHAE
jgi:diaminopimelate decarboxylase